MAEIKNPNIVYWNDIYDWSKDVPDGKAVSFDDFASNDEICPVCSEKGYLVEGFADQERGDGWSQTYVCEECGIAVDADNDYIDTDSD